MALIQRHIYHSIFNQVITDEELEETIAYDDTNEAMDYIFLFVLWCALGAFVLNYNFKSETVMTVWGFVLLFFGLVLSVSMRLRTPGAFRWNAAPKKVKKMKWKKGYFVSLEKSPGMWVASYWINFRDDKKEYRQYINKKEYEKLLQQKDQMSEMIILEYPKCCLLPIATKGHRVFDASTVKNESKKPFPKGFLENTKI